MLTIILHDEDVKTVIDVILQVNSKGNPGDGKIFVINIDEAVAIRTLERGESAI
jgi:nitrogen regulatory protein PII 2